MASPEEIHPMRRIVTGENAEGRSFIVSDGPTPNFGKSPVGPLYLHTPWVTGAAAVGPDEPAPDGHHFGFFSEGGSILRIIDYPPDELVDGAALRAYNEMQGVADPSNPRHYGFHRTDTIEYAIVLEGEIYAMLDEDETLMKAGDVLVQRATNHSWSNRSTKNCRVAFVVLA